MHYLHRAGLSGGFAPLNLPPSDGAPEPIASAIDEYVALREKRRQLTRERAALAGVQPERLAAEQDARLAADRKPPKHRKALEDQRAATSHAIAGLQVQLNDVLLKLIDAIETHGDKWIESLASVKADAETRTTEALGVIEEQAYRMTEAARLRLWVEGMPTRCKWAGDLQPLPEDLLTPISTLARYMRGDIGVDRIGIAKPPLNDAA